MKAKSIVLYVCFIIFLTSLLGHKQPNIEDELFTKMNTYFKENASFGLYVHTDKNIYVPGETLWFKAYLTGDTSLINEVLYVRLTDQNNQSVIKKEFVMYDVRAHGNITLPDDLAEGTYNLYAYTDKMINFSPREVFNRKITVVDNSTIALDATAFLADTAALSQGRDVNVICKLTRDGVSVADARCRYVLSDTSDNVFIQGKTNTNNIGGAMFTLPADKFKTAGPLILNISFRKNKVEKLVRYVLPARNEYFHLNTNVKQNNCIAGIPYRLQLRVADLNDVPVKAKVTLLHANNRRQITTSLTGKGEFVIEPETKGAGNDHYRLLVEYKGLKQQYPLHLNVLPAGYTMQLKNVDSGHVAVIHKKNAPDQLVIVLRNERDMLWSKPLNFEQKDSLMITIPTTDSDGQLKSIALFSTDGKLITEQTVPVRYNPLNMVVNRIKKDGKNYMTIQLSTQTKQPGNVSIAVVARQVIDTAKYTAIQPATTNSEKTCTSLRYSWNDILTYKPKRSISSYSNTAGVWGVVKHASKSTKPIKVKHILLKNADGLNLINIDANGQFSIPAEMLIVRDGVKNDLYLENKFRIDYQIEIKDYAGLFDQRITGGRLTIVPRNTISYEISETPITRFKDLTSLKTVNINAKKIESWPERLARQKANYPPDCGDYVCMYNILNCENHKPSENPVTHPVLGETYVYLGSYMVYSRCMTHSSKPQKVAVKNIELPLDFNKVNVDGFTTTVYWEPNVYTDQKGDAYTEVPITSNFIKDYRIVVEGVTEELKPLFNTQTFKWITIK